MNADVVDHGLARDALGYSPFDFLVGDLGQFLAFTEQLGEHVGHRLSVGVFEREELDAHLRRGRH